MVNGAAALQTAISSDAGTSDDGRAITGGDVGVVRPVSAAFDDAHGAGATRVTFNGLSLSGSDTGNYTLTPHADDAVARITAKALTLSSSKTYDGTRALTGAVTRTRATRSPTWF